MVNFNKTGFILNIVTFSFDIITCLNSFVIFLVIICYISYHRIKQEDRVTIIHCISIYILLGVYTTILVISNIQTMLGDLYGYEFDSS